MKKMRTLIAAMLVLVLLIVPTACGSPSAPASDGDAPTTLVIGLSESIATMDVNQEASISNYYISALVTEGLVAMDNDGNPIPGLAESWETDDYTVWTIGLRDGAQFSDGSPVTAEDIIWSIERAADPLRSPGVSYLYPDVRDLEELDESTIRITLGGPQPDFIWSISNAGGLFVTQKDWGENAFSIGSPQDLLFGSGPYKVTEFSPGSHVTLEAQEHWWGGTPEIESIRFDFITDDATRLLAFTQGDIDFALNIPVNQGAQWQAVSGATVQFYANRSFFGLMLDPIVEPFENEHVRKAVAYAIDAEGIIASILDGRAVPATAITPPEQFASVMSVSEAEAMLAEVFHYPFDLEAAKREFELSGVAPFETTVYFPSSHQEVGQASLVLADALSEVGITLRVMDIPFEQWMSEMGNGEQGIAWMCLYGTNPNPSDMAGWMLDGEWKPSNFTDAEISRLIAQSQVVSAEEGVEDLVRAHELANEQAYYVPVWWGEAANAWGGNLTVTDFNTFTLLSQNWTQQFKLD